jgi:pyruvate carboxylase
MTITASVSPGAEVHGARRARAAWAVLAVIAAGSGLAACASEVYLHEMPGGQFTNLREQARAMGLEARWPEVAEAYAAANRVFGDIIKVTPSSKFVGDMALLMVLQGLTEAAVCDPDTDIAFPAGGGDAAGRPGPAAWGMARGGPNQGAHEEATLTERPGALVSPTDIEAMRARLAADLEWPIDDEALASSLMYPKVFKECVATRDAYGPIDRLPTAVFFSGMRSGEEIAVEIEPGKTLVILLQAIGEREGDGSAKLFFELNGQPRIVHAAGRAAGPAAGRPKADPAQASQVGAPMAGAVAAVAVRAGQIIVEGAPLLTLEAMKMEAVVYAPRAGVVAELLAAAGDTVEAGDLLLRLQ